MPGPVPSSAQPLGTVEDKPVFLNRVWQRFFNSFGSAAAPIVPVTLTASPFAFTAGGSGTVYVTGGTVSSITLTRAGMTVATGITAGSVPVANGDVVEVAYSVLPTITFVPA